MEVAARLVIMGLPWCDFTRRDDEVGDLVGGEVPAFAG